MASLLRRTYLRVSFSYSRRADPGSGDDPTLVRQSTGRAGDKPEDTPVVQVFVPQQPSSASIVVCPGAATGDWRITKGRRWESGCLPKA